jgi:hypothetical protein
LVSNGRCKARSGQIIASHNGREGLRIQPTDASVTDAGSFWRVPAIYGRWPTLSRRRSNGGSPDNGHSCANHVSGVIGLSGLSISQGCMAALKAVI